MKKRLLFILSSDPRSSHRPAEAIRIAAGVGVWKEVDISVYLRGPAVLALGEGAEGLVDEENYTRYLPSLCEAGRPLYVERGAPMLARPGPTPFPFEEIDDAQLAALTARSTCILRF